MAEHAYAYYPGCTLHSTAKEYDISTRLVCDALGIELHELEGWICCGASSAHTTSRLLGLALPAHTLLQAQKTGLPLAVPCAMCFSRLKFAIHDLEEAETRDLVSQALEQEVGGSVAVEPMLAVLASKQLDLPLARGLSGLRVACYYGCLLVKPRAVTNFDDEENPKVMEQLMERLGAEAVAWGLKTECCGASLPLARPDMVSQMTHRLLSLAVRSGADCVSVACPMCHSNLDMYQKAISAKYKEKIDIPILYFTQLMGLALGIPAAKLMLNKHITDPLPLLRRKGLA